MERRNIFVNVDFCFFFQAEDGIRDAQESRGLGDVYKRQLMDNKIYQTIIRYIFLLNKFQTIQI